MGYIRHLDVLVAHNSDKLDELNTKVDQQAITLAEHGRTLAEHSAKLNTLKRTQDAVVETQSEHTGMLQEILRRLPAPPDPTA